MTRVLAGAALAGSAVVKEEESIESAPLYLLRVPMARVESWRYRVIKRSLDVLLSAVVMALVAIPAVVIAALIRLTSEGPIFFRERRIGRYGDEFWILKFRSMRCNTPHHAQSGETRTGSVVLEWRMKKHCADPRITPIGNFLRRWSLDELPQLINVFRGEMSLVGPRPIVKAETAYYGTFFAYYLAAKPGMSGLWQVSGRSDIGYPMRVKMDASYVGSWTLKSDLAILFRTIPAVLARKGAR